MSKVIMVTGGSRSGKSVIAEQKAKEYGKRSVLYLATAIPIDDDMKERIRMHQERRDPEWGTYEGYRDLGEIVKNTEKNTILLDCVTVMITNILFEEEERDFDKISASEVEKLESEVIKELTNLVKAIRDEDKTLIIVSNEVGMSIVPSYRLGRIFSDISARKPSVPRLIPSNGIVFPTSILAVAKMVPSPPITRIHCVPSGISIEVTFLLYWSYTLHTAPILVI